ncbi:T9SS type B sorting domain-containing protein [Tenacibaculum bernardetii]|uniref:T9SS type B sorting domain-containing protein n=1 Tax=Tenacibaculum bernardetii TaxID=3021375 RepID=UPI0023AFAA7E|nr:T9SS type B sorting domain-containing protein [Tenacibaculum bernardetii]
MNKFFTFLLLFSYLFCFSQREADNWYFGDKAGLHFNEGKLDILNNSEMNTHEGSSSISDKNGNLVLYTNGQTVWNKNHQIMINGENLIGEPENAQPAIIVPKPNSDTTFYIFTTRTTELNSPLQYPGIYFSEIEISSRYPLGRVKYKNMRLTHSTSSEITAVHHKNGKDIWVITYGSESYEGMNHLFHAYKVTKDGVERAPVKTELNTGTEKIIGEMKVSPDGSKLALITSFFIYTFNFNNTTGNLSLHKKFTLQTGFTSGYTAYGLSFSPDSKILYYPSIRYIDGNRSYKIMQYDFNNDISGYLGDEVYTDTNSPIRSAASIELASDGKIYVAQITIVNTVDEEGYYNGFYIIPNKTIGVINEPNKLGEDCDYQHDAINLGDGFSYRGLPNFIQSYFRNRIVSENGCISDIFDFSLDAYSTITSATWDFGDGTTSSGLSTNHKYTTPGKYLVTALVTMNGTVTPFYKEVIVYPLPEVIANQELIQCDANNDGIDYFDLNDINNKVVINTSRTEFVFYKNILDAENDENKISNPESFLNESNPQELFVKVISNKGCFNITNFFIESKFVKLDSIPNYYTCDSSDKINNDSKGAFNLKKKKEEIKTQYNLINKEEVRFYPSLIEAQTTSNLIDIRKPFISSSTTIYVRIDTDLGCGGIEPVEIIVNTVPIIKIKDTYTLCFNPSSQPPIILDGGVSNDRFEWRDQSGNIIASQREFTLTKIGDFSLTVYKDQNGIECANYQEFSVINLDPPIFNQIVVDTENENNTIFVNLNGNSSYEFSLDNVTFFNNGLNHTFNNVEPGVRTIYVRDINNCEPPIQTNVGVIGFPKFFTPNNDDINDVWIIRGATPEFFKKINISIFDRFGKIVYTFNNQNADKGWDGTFNSKNLPSNDYWFHAKLTDLNDKKIDKKGHFSLRKQ